MEVKDWRRTVAARRAAQRQAPPTPKAVPAVDLAPLHRELTRLDRAIDDMGAHHRLMRGHLESSSASAVTTARAAEAEAREATRAVTGLLVDCAQALRVAQQSLELATRADTASAEARQHSRTAALAIDEANRHLKITMDSLRDAWKRLERLNLVVTKAELDGQDLVVTYLDITTGDAREERTRMPKQRVSWFGGSASGGVGGADSVVGGNMDYVVVTEDYTIPESVNVVYCDNDEDIVVRPPSATTYDRRIIYIKRVGSGNVRIEPTSGLIEGLSFIMLDTRYDASHIHAAAGRWMMIS